MCRLLGSVSSEPLTVDEVLGAGRGAFLDLARLHGDGWGHAESLDEEPVRVTKSADSARTSTAFAELAATHRAQAWLTHLRWATLGLAVDPENTHPFTDGTMAFGHNGSIDPPAALDHLIAPGLAATRRGDTDSERMFLALRSRLGAGPRTVEDETEALVRTVDDVARSGAAAKSLNCLLLTPSALFAVCSYDPGTAEHPDYYPLLHRRVAGSVVVTSTGWASGEGWTVLGNGQLLVIERASLRTRVVDVTAPRQAESARR